jgi:hypothetical protein
MSALRTCGVLLIPRYQKEGCLHKILSISRVYEALGHFLFFISDRSVPHYIYR